MVVIYKKYPEVGSFLTEQWNNVECSGGNYLPELSWKYLTLLRTREVLRNHGQFNAHNLAGYDLACSQMPGTGLPGDVRAGFMECWYYDQVLLPVGYQGENITLNIIIVCCFCLI